MIERYCSCSDLVLTSFTNVFQILSTLVNYGESAGRFKPIRNGETFLLCPTYGLNSFSYSSVKYWNSLPDHFRKTVDYSEFKRKLLVRGFS